MTPLRKILKIKPDKGVIIMSNRRKSLDEKLEELVNPSYKYLKDIVKGNKVKESGSQRLVACRYIIDMYRGNKRKVEGIEKVEGDKGYEESMK